MTPELLRQVAAREGVRVEQLTTRSQRAADVQARRRVALALRELGLSSVRIGDLLGGRDHKTILSLMGRDEE